MMSLPAQLDHQVLCDALLGAVLEAGAVEMHHYTSGVAVETKRDESPVTAADREAEAILVAAIAAYAPGIPIIAEEAVAAGILPDPGGACFLVDPLDGTREFINRRDEFTVNIALAVAGVPVFGIVYAPALCDIYVTLGPRRAARAQVQPGSGRRSVADCGFRDISTRIPDRAALTAVASRSHMTAATEAYLARYRVHERRDAGSSLKFCVIARGDADIYPRLGPTMAWDTAAGHAVLVAAGGAVTNLDGTPLSYGTRKSEAAIDRLRNPHFVAWGTGKALPPAPVRP